MKKYIIASVLFFSLISTAHAQSYVFSTNLTVGSRGADVVALQTWLISNGYDIPAITSGAAVKGYFGSQTRASVMRMQVANGIPHTGFVGPLTRGRLNAQNASEHSLRVVSPNGNEIWVKGTTQSIVWTGSVPALNQLGNILLTPSVPPCAEPSANPRCMIAVRAPYRLATGITLSSRSYVWRVGDYQNDGTGMIIPDGKYKMEICTMDSSACDTSDAYFNIASSTVGTL